jgi:G8 domain-containing protein
MQFSGQHAARPPQPKLVIVVTVILGLAVTAGGLVLVIPSTDAAPYVRNVRSGAWSDPSTWSGGHVPLASDPATIAGGTTVTVAGPVQAAGVTVDAEARLAFDPNSSATLVSTRNIIVDGTLSMRPASSSIAQTIRFTGVDATRFVGGGMDPVDSDVGLWVMGAGQLDLAGTPKTG